MQSLTYTDERRGVSSVLRLYRELLNSTKFCLWYSAVCISVACAWEASYFGEKTPCSSCSRECTACPLMSPGFKEKQHVKY